MAIALVQSKSDPETTDPATFVFDSPPTAGNLLVVQVVARSDLTLDTPAGWTRVGPVATPEPDSGYVFYKVAGVGESASVVITGATTFTRATLTEWSGVSGFDVSVLETNQPQGGTYTVGPITPGGSTALVLGMILTDTEQGSGTYNIVPSVGWTLLDRGYVSAVLQPNYLTAYQIAGAGDGPDFSLTGTLDWALGGGSNGKWAGILVAFAGVASPSVDRTTLEICGPDGTGCVTIDAAQAKRYRAAFNDPGEGYFEINRYDSQATAANFARGNLVRMTFLAIDDEPIVEFFLETGDFDLIESDEEGAETLHFGGSGSLVYLRNALLSHENLQFPYGAIVSEGVWRWSGPPLRFGSIARRMIDEAQLHTPNALPYLTYTFDDADDSDGVPWGGGDGDWDAPIGSDLLTEITRLIDAGQMHARMDPGIVLSLFQTLGRDLTGAFGTGNVRFEKGVNISSELSRQLIGRDWASHVLVQTKNDYFWVPGTGYPYVREAFLDLSNATDTGIGTTAAEHRILRGDEVQDSIVLEHVPTGRAGEDNDESAGLYYPGPPWSAHGKFWPGDLVTVHTGTGDFDYNATTFRVYAITLYEDEAGQLAPPIVELNSPVTPQGDDLNTTPAGSSSDTGGKPKPTAIHHHTAAAITVTDPDSDFTATNVETALAELAERPGMGIPYVFSTTTTDSDPGSGKLRLSNATQYLATVLRADLLDSAGADVTALLGEMTSGYVRLQKVNDPTKWLVATVSAVASPSGYRNLTIANIAKSANSPFANNDAIVLVADLTGAGSLTNPMTTAGDIIVGGASGTPTRLAGSGTDGWVATYDSAATPKVKWAAPTGSSSADDPIADVFGTPTTAFEFSGSSLAGLTAMATAADTEDANTTIPGHLYLRRNANATYRWVGRYLTPPSEPFTAITKIAALPAANFSKAAIFIGVATPGNMDLLCYIENSGRRISLERDSQTAFSSTPATGFNPIQGPLWLAIRANSSTSYDYLVSTDGRLWRAIQLARNPSLTVASVGLAVNPDSASSDMAAAFDFLRIWNTAKTFPGVS